MVVFQCKLDSYKQIAVFWELLFEAEFFVQGFRKGKSSSKHQVLQEFRLEMSNSFQPLADHGGEEEQVEVGAAWAQFGWSVGSLVGGGGQGSGRKKGSLGKKRRSRRRRLRRGWCRFSQEQVPPPRFRNQWRWAALRKISGDSLACSPPPKMGRSEGEGVQVVQFDKTPDSGRKKQLSIDSFFASPQEKQTR
jgi:hypothetical protein